MHPTCTSAAPPPQGIAFSPAARAALLGTIVFGARVDADLAPALAAGGVERAPPPHLHSLVRVLVALEQAHSPRAISRDLPRGATGLAFAPRPAPRPAPRRDLARSRAISRDLAQAEYVGPLHTTGREDGWWGTLRRLREGQLLPVADVEARRADRPLASLHPLTPAWLHPCTLATPP